MPVIQDILEGQGYIRPNIQVGHSVRTYSDFQDSLFNLLA